MYRPNENDTPWPQVFRQPVVSHGSIILLSYELHLTASGLITAAGYRLVIGDSPLTTISVLFLVYVPYLEEMKRVVHEIILPCVYVFPPLTSS
jgi:uncharacterized membrane protein